MNPIEVLLQESIDYAGLFPPAGLGMPDAVANYAQYQAGPESWALGRFIVPANRLTEFENAAQGHLSSQAATHRWRVAALASPDLATDIQSILAVNQRHTGPRGAVVDTLELKASSVSAINEAMRIIPRHLQAYLEIPIDRDPAELISTVRRSGGRVKVRTGGVTPDAFPSTANLARFIHACVGAEVFFKATAGLHHPLRAEYRLTYAADSAKGVMFGFLNLFLGVALARTGMPERDLSRILEERSPGAFQVDDRGITWRDQRLDVATLRATREKAISSFGSCSFTEPISELQALHLLQPGAHQA